MDLELWEHHATGMTAEKFAVLSLELERLAHHATGMAARKFAALCFDFERLAHHAIGMTARKFAAELERSAHHAPATESCVETAGVLRM